MSKISLTLKLLGDGEWHKIETLKTALELNDDDMQKILVFLQKYGFATVNNTKLAVKVNADFQKLLLQPAT
jgi:hypothetical protein